MNFNDIQQKKAEEIKGHHLCGRDDLAHNARSEKVFFEMLNEKFGEGVDYGPMHPKPQEKTPDFSIGSMALTGELFSINLNRDNEDKLKTSGKTDVVIFSPEPRKVKILQALNVNYPTTKVMGLPTSSAVLTMT